MYYYYFCFIFNICIFIINSQQHGLHHHHHTDHNNSINNLTHIHHPHMIILNDSIIKEVEKKHLNSDLLSMLKKASGVYNNPKSAEIKEKFKNTVIVTGCNHGFLNHLHNFKCFMDRLDMKFLVIAMDIEAHAYLIKNTTMLSYLMDQGVSGASTGESTEFRSKVCILLHIFFIHLHLFIYLILIKIFFFYNRNLI